MTLEEYNYAIEDLNKATVAYDKGEPIMTDAEWDSLYFAVSEYEYCNGCSNPDSPTQKVHFETVSELKKVKHNHPMLSLAKTKDMNEIKSFLGDHHCIVMAKMDGLTCSLRYNNGRLVSAETRGNGIEGEDITHNAMVIPSIPKRICFTDEFIIDGEIICTYKDFEPWADTYKNPRNFAAGSIRLLDSAECAKRNLTFVAWDIVNMHENMSRKMNFLFQWHFNIVPYIAYPDTPIDVERDDEHEIKEMCKDEGYPIDGLVYKYDNIDEYEAAGRTDHHFKGGLAYKFYDEEYDTKLRDIDWTMGRTGVLTPVAVFDPVDADGSIIERASLHNYSVMKELLGEPFVGERLKVCKMNMIIPQVVSAKKDEVSASKNVFNDIKICPICGEPVEIVTSDSGVKNVMCMNPACQGKLVNRLDHFCGKKGMDIKGLSKKTLEKLIDLGWLTCLSDIIDLQDHAAEWKQLPGFGDKSVDNIIDAIDDRFANASLVGFISGLGIPLIGHRVSQQICERIDSWEEFRHLIDTNFDFSIWDGFGYEMNKSLHDFDYSEADEIIGSLTIKVETPQDKSVKLDGKIFVITGKLIYHNNRQQLINEIEAAGGKVASAVSSKTNYLVNNDVQSTSAKNKKALELKVPIITEEELMEMMEDE